MVWDAAWQEAANFDLAHNASRKRDIAKALDYIDHAAVMIVLFVSFGGKLIRDGISRLAIKA